MNIGVTIKAIHNKRRLPLTENQLAVIHIEVYFKDGATRRWINTKIKIEKKHWGTTGAYVNKVKPSHPNHIRINQFLSSKINEIETLIYNTLNSGGKFTPLLLENYLTDNGSNIGFLSFYESETKQDELALSEGTKKEHRYTLSILKEFHPDMRFSDINFELIQSFDRFLRKRGLAQNTIYKHHQHFIRFLNIAIKRNIFDAKDNPYNQFQSKKVKSDRENLTMDEVMALMALDLSEEMGTIGYIRDLFLFSCFTGLRFGDAMNLTNDKIDFKPKDNTLTVRTTMEKVENTRNIKLVLPLHQLFNGMPMKILLKYFNPKGADGDTIFQQLTNQEVNRQLKILAIASKIKMVLSFHISRHTFGSLLADITANPYLIMQLMGHADIKTSMIYIHQSESRLTKSLEKYESVKWLPITQSEIQQI